MRVAILSFVFVFLGSCRIQTVFLSVAKLFYSVQNYKINFFLL